ncbi:PEP-CTERM sorting domain-containing protein [Neptunomonas antarctica]|uniref:PEP-CTERM protein-sorting domain-containing protein n=1 Tax=Neptunomonas antarctica TaxID=619304 RepID=A0A1N7L171_9GAMM|nr:PEP-CTERM sorting domain-containing protein [Neptunomonas antarctica]SIS67400.1 PEP-CTERM protein-sorting domain-containing protein [Neptunomonas antarctica]
MNIKMLKAAVTGLILSTSSFANAGLVDLNAWTATSGGTWNVDGSGTSVLQTTNGDPTYFLSDSNYINTKFDGTFGVETSGDDDFIGFAFGYSNSNDFLLFDWKQGNQSHTGYAPSGFTLSKISGASVNYWDHSGSDIVVLASDYVGNNGWADNTVYDFSLDFTTTGIKIDIDGANIFDVSGSFNTGKFGFYNYSQSQVRYTGFTEEVSPSAIPEPSTLAIFALGIMGLATRRFKKKS